MTLNNLKNLHYSCCDADFFIGSFGLKKRLLLEFQGISVSRSGLKYDGFGYLANM